MLYTIDEWRETGSFTPLMTRMERNGMLKTIDEWRETEFFTPLIIGGKRNDLHH